MAGRSGLVASILVTLALTGNAAGRAILSVQGGAQYDLDDVNAMHSRLMRDLKAAQEKAGIFVDDEHLFTQPLSNSGRRLRQASAETFLSDPNVLAALMSTLSSGLSVGSFPGAALNLPGGSPFGYAPTDNSYCLFSTQPNSGGPMPQPVPLAPAGALPGSLPGSFSCVSEQSGTATTNGFRVEYGGVAYVCDTPTTVTPIGRRLQQAPSPADVAISNALAAIGIPIWNCVVATTPTGQTTLGQATEAILNDLGVIAEHLLVYLNANGQLTYQDNVKNNFVSLANPLYPTGPRLNVSIDFAAVAKDAPLFEEIFRQPAPPAPVVPPTAAAVTGTTSTATGTNPSTTTAGSTATGGTATGSQAATGGEATAATATGQTAVVQTPQGAVPVSSPAAIPQLTRLAAFDGYLDNCQTVIGSPPNNEGNFDRTNNFSTIITDGVSNMTTESANQFAGQVAYVIPASKAVEYAPLTLATRKQAQFCYDVATLQPVYNPLATFITANATGMAASPASTVAAFGQAYGLTPDALTQAMCISVPAGETLSTFDALGAAVNGSSTGLAVLKRNVQIANLVSAGANLLTNDTTTYASYAIIMDQAIARQAVSPSTAGRRLLQAPAPAAACAVDLSNATTTTTIISIALQSVPAQSDEATRSALLPVTQEQVAAVGAAVASLNAAVEAATDATSTEVGQLYAETQLAPQVSELATGVISSTQFSTLTSPGAITTALAGQTLPGQLVPTPVLSPSTAVTPITQSSTETTAATTSSGISHGGKVALATVLPIVGVIAIAAAVAFYMSRRNAGTAMDSSNNSAVWWRRPFARSGGSASPIAGSSASV